MTNLLSINGDQHPSTCYVQRNTSLFSIISIFLLSGIRKHILIVLPSPTISVHALRLADVDLNTHPLWTRIPIILPSPSIPKHLAVGVVVNLNNHYHLVITVTRIFLKSPAVDPNIQNGLISEVLVDFIKQTHSSRSQNRLRAIHLFNPIHKDLIDM